MGPVTHSGTNYMQWDQLDTVGQNITLVVTMGPIVHCRTPVSYTHLTLPTTRSV